MDKHPRRRSKIPTEFLSEDTWQKIQLWDMVLPPSRPSQYHLNIIKDEIDKINRNLPVAVLGSTPEYRDLLFQLGFKDIYIFEKSLKTHSMMNRQRCWSNSENLIKGDWLDTIPQYKDHFDLILSDLTSGNLPYSRQPSFYSGIASALSQDGLYIDKILIHGNQKRKLEKLILKYSTLPYNLLYVNYFSCEFLFCSELLDIKQIVDSSLFYSILEKMLTNGPLAKFLAESPKITPLETFWYYGKDWEEIRKWYFQNIYQVKIYEEEEASPYYGNLKIIVSKKRM